VRVLRGGCRLPFTGLEEIAMKKGAALLRDQLPERFYSSGADIALIKKTYGIGPAKTMDQMLYKRASKDTIFYKTAEGRFGLLALKATTEDVRTPTTADA